MADPVSWLAIGSSVVSGGLQMAQGLNQASAMRARAKAAEYDAKVFDLRGKQRAAAAEDQLNDVMASINTIRAARGGTSGSATGRAIAADRRSDAQFAENNAVLSERFNAQSRRNRASGLRSGARFAAISGFARGFSSFLDAGSTAFGPGGPLGDAG
jgi:hypothetical protein